jgi:hypothetical protein
MNEAIKKEIEEIKNKIVIFAQKVVNYPKGSRGYDPIDMMNLEYQVKEYEEALNKF